MLRPQPCAKREPPAWKTSPFSTCIERNELTGGCSPTAQEFRVHVRAASEADLPAIQAIYAHHVLHGLATFEEVPPTVDEPTSRPIAARGKTRSTWPTTAHAAAPGAPCSRG